MTETYLFAALALVAFGLAVWIAVYSLAVREVPERPNLGLRGLKRRAALRTSAGFAVIEPVVRLVGGWVSYLPLLRLRARLDRSLRQAGDWLGLDANELLALCLVSALAGIGIGYASVSVADLPEVALFFFAGLFLALPYLRLTGELTRRRSQVTRGLPPAIDVAALCMSAGMTFPDAIHQVVTKSGRPDDPLNEELELILHQLSLGIPRRRALENLAERVPTEPVKSFVGAVVQSEEKGTPLVAVLQIQSETMRTRRSVSGEEAASRAAVLMMIPLMLILCATILVLLGPFLIRGAGTF